MVVFLTTQNQKNKTMSSYSLHYTKVGGAHLQAEHGPVTIDFLINISFNPTTTVNLYFPNYSIVKPTKVQ